MLPVTHATTISPAGASTSPAAASTASSGSALVDTKRGLHTMGRAAPAAQGRGVVRGYEVKEGLLSAVGVGLKRLRCMRMHVMMRWRCVGVDQSPATPSKCDVKAVSRPHAL